MQSTHLLSGLRLRLGSTMLLGRHEFSRVQESHRWCQAQQQKQVAPGILQGPVHDLPQSTFPTTWSMRVLGAPPFGVVTHSFSPSSVGTVIEKVSDPCGPSMGSHSKCGSKNHQSGRPQENPERFVCKLNGIPKDEQHMNTLSLT